MNPTDIDIADIVALARRAGEAILEVYHSDFAVEHKEDRSPLTLADKNAHQLIVEGLARLTPEVPVLSEESAEIPFETRRGWSRYWLVDPLDGTREFVKRNGEFTVNIALIDGHSPVLGVVHIPVTGVTYYGAKDQGAFRRDGDQTARPIQVAPLGDGPVRVAGSRSHAGESLLRFLERLGNHDLISIGSSLKLCLVAEGRADLYPRLGPTSEWDTAAAQCVVEAAGGRVTDTGMRTLSYNSKESLLNPHFLVFGDRDHDWSAYLD